MSTSSNLKTVVPRVLTGSSNWMAWAPKFVLWAQLTGCAYMLEAASVDSSNKDNVDVDTKLKGAIKTHISKPIMLWLLELCPPINPTAVPLPVSGGLASARPVSRALRPTTMVSMQLNLLQDITSTAKYWEFLKAKYRQHGLSASFQDFEILLTCTIPNNCHPGAAMDKIAMHINSMATVRITFLPILHGLLLFTRLPACYNITKQLYAISTDNASSIDPLVI